MSKGLNAWKELLKMCDDFGSVDIHKQEPNKSIIEKELKDSECLDSFFNKIRNKYGIDDLDYLEHICSQYEEQKRFLDICKHKKPNLCDIYWQPTYESYLLSMKNVEDKNWILEPEEFWFLK